MQRATMPRLPFFRLLLPRLSKPPILPTNRSLTGVRVSPNSSRGFRTYAPLRRDSPPPSPDASSSELPDNTPLGAKLKLLIKSYGWYALGVYLAISVVDFTVAFAAVNFFGAEQVGRVTAYAKGAIHDMMHGSSPDDSPDGKINGKETATTGGEGLYAMIILAYTVHKVLFMPLRVGVTMAITPKLVRWLRMKGWTGPGGATRAASHVRERIKRNVD